MLLPRQRKYRKCFKDRIRHSSEFRSNKIIFGFYGLQALSKARLNSKQIEAIRRTITSYIKRNGKVWIRVFPDRPVTKKPVEIRMGRGKGNVNYWSCFIKPGQILYEVVGQNPKIIKEALSFASTKMAFKTQVIERN